MATQPQTSNPVWYLAWVRQVSALMRRPISGHGEFSNGQQVFFWPLGEGKWMVFDGKWIYTILDTQDAMAALKSCRDTEGKARLAENQEELTEHFYRAVSAQGPGFTCRPRC
jgi:hypothetical protein